MKIATYYAAFAARDSRWSAVDGDTFDGAPDAGSTCTIGWGATEQEAINDLLEKFEDGEPWQREDAREYRAANGQFGVGA